MFYSRPGHVKRIGTIQKFQQMYVEGIKWAMGLEEGDATPRPCLSHNARRPLRFVSVYGRVRS